MHILDFFSTYPNNYIFQRTSNKTNFGGVCFFLCIIGILCFSIYCIVKFIKQDTYSIEHTSYMYDYNHNISTTDKTIKFNYEIFPYELNNHFDLIDYYTGKIIPKNTNISKPINEFRYIIFYKCEDDICEVKENISNTFQINLFFEVPGLNIQDENPFYPLIFGESLYMTTYDQRIYYFLYEEIIVTDIGFLGNKNRSIIIPKNYMINYLKVNETTTHRSQKYKAFGEIKFLLKEGNWEHYKRTKKSILNTFSYICSIGQAIYNFVKIGFLVIYSHNFNNYKIIQMLLFNKDTNLKKSKKANEGRHVNNNSDFLLSSYSNYDINNNKNELKNDDEENNKIISEEIIDESDNLFPKLSFISYIFNNIYSQKCCNRKNQKFICKCNEIVSKYYSIENILYNQIMIENLLKDYKWNEPKLKRIESNKLINGLKIFIRNNYPDTGG